MKARYDVGAYSQVYAGGLSLAQASRRAQRESKARPGVTIMVWPAGPAGVKAVGQWLDGRAL